MRLAGHLMTLGYFISGSGKVRRNTLTFVKVELKPYLTEALYCGLNPDSFGNEFIILKHNAYFGLNMSGVTFIKQTPRVCVISDYEFLMKDVLVDFVQNADAEFAINHEDGTTKTDSYNTKKVTQTKKDIKINAFDGQGLISDEYSKVLAKELGYNDFIPSQFIIRSAWIKGMLCRFRFKDYFKQYGITKLLDIFGVEHEIEKIDVLLSQSQFKMHKIYAKMGG